MVNIALKYSVQLSLHQKSKARCRHSITFCKFFYPQQGIHPTLVRVITLRWFRSASNLPHVFACTNFTPWYGEANLWFKETCLASTLAVAVVMVVVVVGMKPGLPTCKQHLLTIMLPWLILRHGRDMEF